jgi:hypothetical protein
MGRATRDEWQRRVRRWGESGLTAKEFAAETGVNVNSLTHWKWKWPCPDPVDTEVMPPGRVSAN